MSKTTNKRKAYIQAYNAENYRRVYLALHRTIDADLIDHLEKHDNIRAYIKDLIREDMKRSK